MDLKPLIDQLNPVIKDLATKLAHKHLYDKYEYEIEVSGSMVEKYDATIHKGNVPHIYVNLDFILSCLQGKNKPRLSYVITKMLENVARMRTSLGKLDAPADNLGIKRQEHRLTKNIRHEFVTDTAEVETIYTVTVSKGDVEVSLNTFNASSIGEARRLAIIKLAELTDLTKQVEIVDDVIEYSDSNVDSIGIKSLNNETGTKYEFDISDENRPTSGDDGVQA